MPMDSDTGYICTGDNGTAKIVQPHERSRERRAVFCESILKIGLVSVVELFKKQTKN